MKTKEKANRFIGIIAENIEKGQTVKRKKLNRAFYGAIDNLPNGKLKAELQKNSDTYFKQLKRAISKPQVTKQQVQYGRPIERFPYNLFDKQGNINTDVIAEKEESLQCQIYANYISRRAHCLSSNSELYKLCNMCLEAKAGVPKWLHDFNMISCMTISNKSGRALQCIMERFHLIANEKVEESLQKKTLKSANAIKEGLVYFMVWCHFKVNEVEAFSSPSYEDLMASVLSLYVDLVIHTSRNLDVKVRKLLGKELATRVGLLLHQHPSHILDVLLQLTMVEELDVDVVGQLYRKALEGSIDVTTCEQYVKYMATVAQFLNTFQSDDVSNAMKLKALAIPAPGDLLDWIGQHQRSLLDMMPIERKFKGAAITRFLLDEGNEEIWASILDIIGENTQTAMPKIDSTKAVADKGDPMVGEPAGDNLEETPLYYMDTSADPAVAVLMENEVKDVPGENGEDDLIIEADDDVIVEEDDDIRVEDDDVMIEDDQKDPNIDTPALFELNKNLNSKSAHEKDEPDIIEELYVIDTAPTRMTLSQVDAEMTPQAENGVSDNEDIELIDREDVERKNDEEDVEKTEEIYVVDTEKWSKKSESIVSQMNLPDTISPICTPPRSSRRTRAGTTPKVINIGDSPKSSIGREMKATPKALIDRAPATDQTQTPIRKSKANPVETIEEINLDEDEDVSPKSSITQETKSSPKVGRKSLPNPVEVVEEIDLVASDTETKDRYTKLKTPSKTSEKVIAPISQSKKGSTMLVSPRRTRRTSQMQMEKVVDEITVVEETQPSEIDMFESQDAQIVDNSSQDKGAESKEEKNVNGDDETDVAVLEVRQDRVSDTSDNEGNEATTFAIPDISKHLKKGPGENSMKGLKKGEISIKGLKKGENSGVKRGKSKEDVASDTSEDTHISSIPNISQHLKTDENQVENSIDDKESTKSVGDKTPKLSKKTKTPRRSSRKSIVKTSPCCEEKKNKVITDVTLTRKNVIAALQETDSDAATPLKQKRAKLRNVKRDDKFSPPNLRSRNSSGDSINASTKGKPQKSESLKKSTGINDVYDFHGSASELSDFGTPPKRKMLSPISEVNKSLTKSGKKTIKTPKSKIPLEFETTKTSTRKTPKLKTPSTEEKLKTLASSRKRLSTPKQTVETPSKLKQAKKEAMSEKRPRRESANY